MDIKAKNFLSSVVALAFAQEDNENEAFFLAQAHQIQCMLQEQQIFRFVYQGNAYTKFFNQMISMTKDNLVYKQVVALEYLAVLVNGSPIEHLEPRISKLLDVVYHALKHQHTSVCVPALKITCTLLQNAQHASNECRRAIIEQIGRIVPLIIQHLHEVALATDTTEYFIVSYNALYTGLTHHSTSFRSFAIKIEQACLLLLNAPTDLSIAKAVLPSMSQCLGAIANATPVDTTSATWQQLVERAVLALHYHLDIAAGKDSANDTKNRPASLKNWTKDTTYATLPLYLQAQRIQYKCDALSSILVELLANVSIGEIDIVKVAADILAVLRRAFSIRADTVGKQSAISEDGRQLPVSVLYGLLPQLQIPFMKVFAAFITRGHVTLFRFASLINKVIMLVCHSSAPRSHQALYEMLQTIISTMGSGAFTSMTYSVLQWVLNEVEGLLSKKTMDVNTPSKGSQPVNAKKRRRDQLPLVTESTATSLSIDQISLVQSQVNGALETLATILLSAGQWIAYEDRIRITTIMANCQNDSVLKLSANAITSLSLANSVVVDAQGNRGIALAQNMLFWSNKSSGVNRTLALNVGESLLHPRAPPMMIDLTPIKPQSSQPRNNSMMNQQLAQDMDWDDDEEEKPVEKEVEEVEEDDDDCIEDEKDESSKRQKVDTPIDDKQEQNHEKDNDSKAPEETIDEPMNKLATPVPEAVEHDKDTKDENVIAVPAMDDEEFDFPDIVDDEE
ncbi:hypothetical protein THRCLA_11284 [Thraustotheca clavata]|uniref:Pre-rRNA-processing protein RIX1 N-terminal domain-containing protein n=1 Tax=Thraustotheca clavata TaxID=74557 RepID=A0A1V9Y888_9STRA|nr:hypothetical protein THRCLA_11284 [Thraustotheca clavata]